MGKKVIIALALIIIGSVIAFSQPAPQAAQPGFWEYWGDGKAELAGYKLSFPRYGEIRKGTAVSIFVTETFSKSHLVKAEKGQIPAEDELPVFKLNLVKDFPTGIYDYNIMTSVFTSVEPYKGRRPGDPVKISFSSQEWCGNMYSELRQSNNDLVQDINSYFIGESVRDKVIDYPQNAVIADQVPFLVRGLLGPIVSPGESITVPYLISEETVRLKHKEPKWQTAVINRSAIPVTVKVPAGIFKTEVWTIKPESSPAYTYYVSTDYPHHIVKWESTEGETAEMTGTTRLLYWKLKGGGDEGYLKKIGL